MASVESIAALVQKTIPGWEKLEDQALQMAVFVQDSDLTQDTINDVVAYLRAIQAKKAEKSNEAGDFDESLVELNSILDESGQVINCPVCKTPYQFVMATGGGEEPHFINPKTKKRAKSEIVEAPTPEVVEGHDMIMVSKGSDEFLEDAVTTTHTCYKCNTMLSAWDDSGYDYTVKGWEDYDFMELAESDEIKAMYRKAGMKPPKGRGIHTKKFHTCVTKVGKKAKEAGKKIVSGDIQGDNEVNPFSICMKSIGRDAAVKKSHRRAESIDKAVSILLGEKNDTK